MFGRIGTPEILLLVLIVLLLFGAARLPKLARSLREAKDEFQKGQDEKKDSVASSGSAPAAEPRAEGAAAPTDRPPDTT